MTRRRHGPRVTMSWSGKWSRWEPQRRPMFASRRRSFDAPMTRSGATAETPRGRTGHPCHCQGPARDAASAFAEWGTVGDS
jgi:hypothetical protein